MLDIVVRRRNLTLLQIAESFLEIAREEANRGYKDHDERRIRDAAEKAWNAALQATDHAMHIHGRAPEPGRGAHADRHEFLEAVGQHKLSKELSYFADRLHGECFYQGACPSREGMETALKEVEDYVRKIKDNF